MTAPETPSAPAAPDDGRSTTAAAGPPPPHDDPSHLALTPLQKARIYVAIPATLLLYNSAFFLTRNLLPNYLLAHGLEAWSGWLQALLPLVSLALAVPLGLMSDRFSPRRLALGGIVLFVIFAALLWWRADVATGPALFAMYFLCGVSAVVMDVSLRPLYLKQVGHTGGSWKIALITAAGMFGFGAGAFAAGLGWKMMGWSIDAQLRLSLPIGILALLAALCMRDAEPVQFNLAAYRASILRRPVLVYFAVLFVNALHFGVEAVCLAPFLKVTLSLTDWWIGVYFGSIGVLMAVTAAACAAVREHAATRYRLWAVGLAASALMNAATVVALWPWLYFVLRFGHVIADALMLTASLRIVAAVFPRRRVGGPMGLSGMITTVGVLCGAVGSGALSTWTAVPERFRYGLPFAVAGLALLLALAAQIIIGERFDRCDSAEPLTEGDH